MSTTYTKARRYCEKVADVIATHGHRGNAKLCAAAEFANRAIRDRITYSEYVAVAEQCANAVREGLKTFNPDHQYFSASAAVAYAFLLADYNSVK